MASVTAIKAKLLECIHAALAEGVLAVDAKGEQFVCAADDKMLKLALDVVKAFHDEVKPTVEAQGQVTGLLARYKERQAGRADA